MKDVISTEKAPRAIGPYSQAIRANGFVFASGQVAFDPAAYETRQVFTTSKDGTRVPMFLFYKKGLEPNGQVPTLLTGYGGFDMSMSPYFSTGYIVWLQSGGLLVIDAPLTVLLDGASSLRLLYDLSYGMIALMLLSIIPGFAFDIQQQSGTRYGRHIQPQVQG